MKARNFIPALKFGAKIYPEDVAGIGYMTKSNKYWFVDGDKSTGGAGGSWEDAYATIQDAVTAAGSGDIIFIAEKKITDYSGDPTSYAETIIIPETLPHLSLIGISRGLTQGGLPQIKPATTTSYLLTIRAPGCLIYNLGFNGANSTGGGIYFDTNSAATKSAWGTSIMGCHFKNCVGTSATNAITGGAIVAAATGHTWQIRIQGNRFYKCVGDVVMKGTTDAQQQDWVIEDNIFTGEGAVADCNLYLAGGDGITGVVVRNNVFPAVPAVGSGTNHVFVDMTGCTGILCGNYFGCLTNDAATELTFLATTGTGGKVPTTVRMAGNFGESSTVGEAAEAIIYRHA